MNAEYYSQPKFAHLFTLKNIYGHIYIQYDYNLQIENLCVVFVMYFVNYQKFKTFVYEI